MGWFSLAIVLAFGGCVFYDIPATQTLRESFTAGRWLRLQPTAAFSSFKGLDDAVARLKVIEFDDEKTKDKPDCERPHLEAGGVVRTPAAEFLHVSDAQIRDERMYSDFDARRALETADFFVPVSIRRDMVEAYDSLVLTAFLIGHGKCTEAHGAGPRPFAIHTGDLTDISVSSELMEALESFRQVTGKYPFQLFSVAGNHDGLTFGNISDLHSDTHSIGVNRSEFVVAHVLDGRDRKHIAEQADDAGYGFAHNEVWVAATAKPRPIVGESPGCRGKCREIVADLYDDLADRAKEARKRPIHLIDMPMEYRRAIDTIGDAEEIPVRLGYYAWRHVPPPNAGPAVRFVVLDTRNEDGSEGDLDPVQLLWLYDQVGKAHSAGEAVIRLRITVPRSSATCGCWRISAGAV